MAITTNTTWKNAQLNAINTLLDGATLTIRSGAAPGAGASAAGTVLATMTLPADAMAAASGGAMAKLGTWSDTSADATGTAQHFRIVCVDGSVLEGTVTLSGNGGDITLSLLDIVAGGSVSITTFVLSA